MCTDDRRRAHAVADTDTWCKSPLQGTSKDAASVIKGLLPLETILLTQTYLVQDTLSLADIVVALDLKHTADTVGAIALAFCFI